MSIDIEQMKRDREAGTSGPFWISGNLTVRAGKRSDSQWICNVFWFRGEVNARRIARVPDMEAALLAAEELAKAVADIGWQAPADETDRVISALAAYRAATGGAE